MKRNKFLGEDAQLIGSVSLRMGNLKIYKSVKFQQVTMVHEAYGDVANTMSIDTPSVDDLINVLSTIKN